MSNLTDRDIARWRQLVESHKAFTLAMGDFFAKDVNRTELFRYSLKRGDIAAALAVAPFMAPDELMGSFEELVFLCSGSRGDVLAIREVVLSLPRAAVLENIERVAEPLLVGDYSEESYRRLLELYVELDHDLAGKLARRAAEHSQEEIREAGQDFLETLGEAG